MAAPVQAGDLLIATVSLIDPNFDHSVVLVCHHDDSQGSYGLVLNRPITVPAELREEFAFTEGRLFLGGPVEQGRMQILHPFDNYTPKARQVLPGLWVGGDWLAMQKAFDTKTLEPAECRFFLGYSGWDKGQLAGEFEADAWIKVRGTVELIMDTPPEHLWARAIRKCSDEQPLYTNFPDDPSLN